MIIYGGFRRNIINYEYYTKISFFSRIQLVRDVIYTHVCVCVCDRCSCTYVCVMYYDKISQDAIGRYRPAGIARAVCRTISERRR